MAISSLGVSHLHHKPHGTSGPIGASGYWLSNQLLCTILLLIFSGGVSSQDSSTKVLYFQENIEPPQRIGNVALDGATGGQYIVLEMESEERISELPSNARYSDVFDVSLSGEITALVKFDREQKASYSMLVYNSASSADFYNVEIVITDVNDNSPKFPNPYKNISVSENRKSGDQLVVLGSALDRDNGENSTQRYDIISGSNGLFTLDETRVCVF